MGAKSAVLARARNVVSRFQARPVGPIPRSYVHSGGNPPGPKPVTDEMIGKLEGYSAEAIVVSKDAAILGVIGELLSGARSIVVLAGLPEDYKKATARGDRTVVEDSREGAIATLDLGETDAVSTRSRVGISISGTIALDGEPDQGRRAISLVPDKHVVILEREAIMPTMPQAVNILEEHPARPMAWIAGGSATSDIELVCVNGVYDPRNLCVVTAYWGSSRPLSPHVA